MRHTFSLASIRSLVAALSLALLVPCMPLAAEEAKPAATSQPDAAKKKKERADPRGPLPAYYRDVVDGLQREQVYKIQESYRPKLAELEAQMKELTEKRDGEIEALLRPEQKERVKKLMADAKAKREMARKAEAAANKPAEATK